MFVVNGDRGMVFIIVGRVFVGIGVGGCFNMVLIYIFELFLFVVRGCFVGIYEFGW